MRAVVVHLTHLIARYGVFAVFAVMALDAFVPAGSEVVMLLAGALAGGAFPGPRPALFGSTLAAGPETYLVLALVGTVGYLLGALVAWVVGRRMARTLLARHGRRVRLGPDAVDRAERWFDRHGAWAVFLARLIPGVRSFVSIPAGVLRTPLGPYTALTFLGSAIWCFAIAGAGWAAGDAYHRLEGASLYVDLAAVAATIAAVSLVVLRGRGRSAARKLTPR